MTRIDFYVLENAATALSARQLLACRLAEKAFLQGHRIYIHVSDAAEGRQLDDLLWSFRPGSFVPHECVDGQGTSETETPVHIGWGGEPSVHDDVLINLTSGVPRFFSRFERVAELVGPGEEDRRQGRERFRFYRDRGYELNSHTIKLE